MTYDIDGAFNCGIHPHLNEIMYYYNLPSDLLGTIGSFTQARTISIGFEGKTEPPAPCTPCFPEALLLP